jgi:hypothetical protein
MIKKKIVILLFNFLLVKNIIAQAIANETKIINDYVNCNIDDLEDSINTIYDTNYPIQSSQVENIGSHGNYVRAIADVDAGKPVNDLSREGALFKPVVETYKNYESNLRTNKTVKEVSEPSRSVGDAISDQSIMPKNIKDVRNNNRGSLLLNA